MTEVLPMQITRVPFSQFPMLAKMDKAYAEQNPILREFYAYDVDIQSFARVIADKKNDKTDRPALVEALKKQYNALRGTSVEPIVWEKIASLANDNAFTVTTAHQPSLFTGPLYFVYKIFSTIHLAEKLAAQYVDNQFVPVFVIGGEDHDFEEVNYINVFNKKIEWQRPEGTGGAVGSMETASLTTVLQELKAVLGESERANAIFADIERAYTENAVYHDATQALLNTLFGKYGLVVLNMNDAALKHLFVPIMQREIAEQPSKKLVEDAQAQLEQLGFKSQAFAREINLFYLQTNSRERIVAENGAYRALNTEKSWPNLEALLVEVETAPQYFSPNVVLRPLYQETVLPNLAYIGGGGELAYWLERKAQFAHFGLNFPMLVRRNSAFWIDKGTKERLRKFEYQLTDLAQDTDALVKHFIARQATEPLSMEAEKAELAVVFDKILEKTVAIEPTLEKTVLAEKAKQLQSIEALEARVLKAEKQKHETSLNQLRALQQKLYPNGGLQERFDNFLPIYLKNGTHFFDVLRENLNPLEQGFVVIEE